MLFNKTFHNLINDETGFVVSAELVLVATLLVLGTIVGLSEVQHAVTQELNDVGDAFGNLNQSYCYSGFSARKQLSCFCGFKSITTGSAFADTQDECDWNQCSISCDVPTRELTTTSRTERVHVEYENAPACAEVKSLEKSTRHQ